MSYSRDVARRLRIKMWGRRGRGGPRRLNLGILHSDRSGQRFGAFGRTAILSKAPCAYVPLGFPA